MFQSVTSISWPDLSNTSTTTRSSRETKKIIASKIYFLETIICSQKPFEMSHADVCSFCLVKTFNFALSRLCTQLHPRFAFREFSWSSVHSSVLLYVLTLLKLTSFSLSLLFIAFVVCLVNQFDIFVSMLNIKFIHRKVPGLNSSLLPWTYVPSSVRPKIRFYSP